MTVQWRKSSHSGGPEDKTCVEVARFPGGIEVRDSKNPAGPRLVLTAVQFAAMLGDLRGRDELR
jgi:hypothetical protein